MLFFPVRVRALPCLAGALLLAGCGREDVQVYRVAKEQPSAPPAPEQTGALPPGHPDVSAGPPKLQWKLPAGWQEAAPGEMRVASFRVPGPNGKQADVSVVPLPGLAGGDLANVNRWRGMVSQPAITQEALVKSAQAVEIAGQPAQLYEMAGQAPGSGEQTRILAAIQHRDGMAWFYKMSGDDDLVAEQKPAFVQFLKSVSFVAGEQVQLVNPPKVVSTNTKRAPAADSGQPAWSVPAGWQEVPAGQMQVARFAVPGEGGAKAELGVSMLTGTGGGMLPNVNRWRNQIGLGEISESEMNNLLTSVEIPGGKATFIDLSGTNRAGQKTRLIGAVVPQANQTWFYKLMGDPSVIEGQKDAFTKYVQTAKYP